MHKDRAMGVKFSQRNCEGQEWKKGENSPTAAVDNVIISKLISRRLQVKTKKIPIAEM